MNYNRTKYNIDTCRLKPSARDALVQIMLDFFFVQNVENDRYEVVNLLLLIMLVQSYNPIKKKKKIC